MSDLYNRKALAPYTKATAEQVNAETSKIAIAFAALQQQIDAIIAGTPIASYTWIAWADSPDGTDNFSNVAAGNRAYIGMAFGKTSPIRSDHPEDYTWSRLRGVDGAHGIDGVDGVDGKWIEYIWMRSPTEPSTPTGNGIPSGWGDEPPLGTDPLWMSRGKQELDGTLIGTWSDPVRMDGPPGPAGDNGLNGYSQARVNIYQRAVSAPDRPSATTTYTFATGALTGLDNGWTQTIPAGSDPVWISSASAVSQGATDTIASGEWASPVQLAESGADGINQATIFLFLRTTSATPPTVPSGDIIYTFATGVAVGMDGGWSQSLPTSGGAYRWVITATALAQGPTDTIASGEWATPAVLAQDGSSGSNVVQLFAYQRASSTPALPSNNATYDFDTKTLSGLNNGWSATIPSGDDPIYVTSATANSLASTDTITPGEWASAVILSANGTNGTSGTNGINAAIVYLFLRTGSPSAPAKPSTTSIYNFTTGVLSGHNNGWTQTLPTSGGMYRWVITASALGTGATDSIGSGEWSAAALIAQDGIDGTDGANGEDGYTISPASKSFAIAANAAGIIKSGELPKSVTIKVLRGLTDLSTDPATGYSVTAASNTSYSLSTNVLSITDLSDDDGYVEVTVSRSGTPIAVMRADLSKLKDGTNASFAQTLVINPGNSASNVYTGTGSNPLTIPVGPNGTVTLSARVSYSVPSGSSKQAAKWQYRTTPGSGGWTDVAAETVDPGQSIGGNPSIFNVNATISGPSSGANWEFQLATRRYSGTSTSATASGPNRASASWAP